MYGNTYCYCFIAQTNLEMKSVLIKLQNFSLARLWLADPFLHALIANDKQTFPNEFWLTTFPARPLPEDDGTIWQEQSNSVGRKSAVIVRRLADRSINRWSLTLLGFSCCGVGGGTHLWLLHIHLLYYSLHSLINSSAWWSGAGSRE